MEELGCPARGTIAPCDLSHANQFDFYPQQEYN